MKLDKLFMTAIALFVLPNANSFAQGPNNTGTYYQAADGKKGKELKTALCAIIIIVSTRSPKVGSTMNILCTQTSTTFIRRMVG